MTAQNSGGSNGKRPVGRPPEPVPEDIAEKLCAWIAEGLCQASIPVKLIAVLASAAFEQG